MRFVGVTTTDASVLEIFVAFSIGLIASMIPILPQGVGAVELVSVWILAGQVGTDLADQIAAAAFTHRIFMWFIPMLVGLIPLSMWRRRIKKDPEANPLGDFATG
jgi:uncharacterized protein (TIRG00374 family)